MPRSYTITDPTGDLTITFNETEDGLLVPDDNGVFWSIEEMEGWDGPDVRQVLVDPYGIDGTIVGVNELSSRLLTLSNGFALAPSEDARWNAELQFGQLMGATVAQGVCTVVVHEDIDRYAYGYLASKPEWKEAPPGAAAQLVNAWPFQFEASLICPYPLKQSPNDSSPWALEQGGTVNIPTLGNYPTQAVFIWSYPVNGDYVNDQFGNEISITNANRVPNTPNPMPTQITLDVYHRTCVDQDGIPAWDVISAFVPIQLLPNGGTLITYRGANPSAACEVQWGDSWL